LRRSFTLIELLISVGLLSLIVLFLYNSLDTLRRSNSFYELNLEKDESRHDIFNTLYFDLLRADAGTISIKAGHEKEFDILTLRSLNSLHKLDRPYITYVVSRVENTLLRIESLFSVKLPISYEFENSVKIDKVANNMELFKFFQDGKKKNILISVNHKTIEPILFEMALSSTVAGKKGTKTTPTTSVPSTGTSTNQGSANNQDNTEASTSPPPAPPPTQHVIPNPFAM